MFERSGRAPPRANQCGLSYDTEQGRRLRRRQRGTTRPQFSVSTPRRMPLDLPAKLQDKRAHLKCGRHSRTLFKGSGCALHA
ncbi:hypothetical protein CYMTET_12726 [Cymbomonas tetramitiformis]|uniref:Uncharacterized protein n=1 Tax=Cymbomonas tetramitiformis TaxID=36881 RepID=A0AAE0GJW4_9CHLO|nr:hypothetical protein CYMTET_12726 [Cymbomonas tetramitiformis]